MSTTASIPSLTCSRCGKTKLRTHFPVNRGNRTGRSCWCLECHRNYDVWRAEARRSAVGETLEKRASRPRGDDGPLSDLHDTLTQAYAHLHRFAAMLQRIVQTRGDAEGFVAHEIADVLHTAAGTERLAKLHRPNPALARWSAGTAAAAKNYRPGTPGRPS